MCGKRRVAHCAINSKPKKTRKEEEAFFRIQIKPIFGITDVKLYNTYVFFLSFSSFQLSLTLISLFAVSQIGWAEKRKRKRKTQPPSPPKKEVLKRHKDKEGVIKKLKARIYRLSCSSLRFAAKNGAFFKLCSFVVCTW